MIFEARDEWEIDDTTIPLLAEKGVRYYPFIKVSLNFIIFHVDFIRKNEEYWERYMFYSVSDVLALLGQKDFDKISISLQSRRCDNEDNEYGVSTIKEIIKAEDKNHKTVYMFHCKNDKTYMESHACANLEELTNKRVIYINQDDLYIGLIYGLNAMKTCTRDIV
jgi:hypothetical protein